MKIILYTEKNILNFNKYLVETKYLLNIKIYLFDIFIYTKNINLI